MLTEEQARFAMQQMSRWLMVRGDHEALDGKLGLYDFKPQSVKRVLDQVRADVDHSSLLHRLLRGREPLPEPPPKEHSYPVYPDYPYGDPLQEVT